MKFKSVLGRVIELSGERKKHIRLRHPDVGSYFHFLGDLLTNPDEIRQSRYDKNVLLFYNRLQKTVDYQSTDECNKAITYFRRIKKYKR